MKMKRVLIAIPMSILFLLNTGFFGWVIWITYLRPLAEASKVTHIAEEEAEASADFQRDLKEHFHNIDDTIYIDKRSPSPCFGCHGTYPHSKAKDVRAFLNAHAFFIACEVCHVKREAGEKFEYKWMKAGTDIVETQLSGKPGNYGAIMVPFKEEDGMMKRIDTKLTDKDIQAYLKYRSELSPDKAAEAKLKLHRGISQKPVFCDDCHQADGYIDFRKLQYKPERANALASAEVVGVVKKYKEFFIPTMFDPKAIMINRQSDAEKGGK